jgi:hypothetical protein
MLNFVRKVFRGGLELILWINLIVWAVGGGIIANMTYSISRYGDSSGIHPVLGVFIGIIAGLLINIVGGGFIATLINMDANIEKLLKGNLPSGASNVNSTENQVHLPLPSSGEAGDEYIVIMNTSLRSEQTESSYPIKPLKIDERVLFQYAPNSNWFYVNTSDSQKGWCLASHLKKA